MGRKLKSSRLKSGMKVKIYGYAEIAKQGYTPAWKQGTYPWFDGATGQLTVTCLDTPEDIYEYKVKVDKKNITIRGKKRSSACSGSIVSLHPQQIQPIKKAVKK